MNKFGKYFLLVTGFALVAPFAPIPGANNKVHAHDRSCSVASLKGKYAFRRSGTINLVGGPNCQGFTDCGPIAEMGVATYDGNGTRGLIRTTRSTAVKSEPGAISPHRTEPTPSIRIVRDHSSIRPAHSKTTSSSLTEARGSSCSARTRAQPSWKRG